MSTPSDASPIIAKRLLAEAYAVVLPEREIGFEDDFFELGGDSIGLIRLISLAQEIFDIEIPVRTFFAEPTLARLVEIIGAGGPPATEADVLAQVEGMTDEQVQNLLNQSAE
jgi:acyl carrier protein